MLTLKDLKTQTLSLLDQAGDLGSGNVGDVNVTNAIAMAHERRLMKDRWSFMLWPDPITLNFVTGVRNYTLHPRMGQLTEFWNTTAGEIMKDTPSRSRYKGGNLFQGIAAGTQGDRFHFEMVQESPVKLPFSSAGPFQVTSGGCTIYYVDTNGNDVVDVLTTNQFTSATPKTVYGITKTDNTQLVTIVDNASLVIANLPAGTAGATYPQIHLFGDGATGEVGTYRFYRRARTLSADNDIPEIPYPFSRVLVYDALLEIATYNDATPPEYWLKQQEEWDMLLRQNYQEGEMEGSESRTVQEVDLYQG